MAIPVEELLVKKEMITDENNIVTSVKVTMSCGKGIFIVLDSSGSIDNSWVRTTDYIAEKTYTENKDDALTVNLGTSSAALVSESVTITITEIGEEAEKVYGYCGSKCKHEVYTKDEVDNLLNLKGAVIYYGTEAPGDVLGNNGDIYIMYE